MPNSKNNSTEVRMTMLHGGRVGNIALGKKASKEINNLIDTSNKFDAKIRKVQGQLMVARGKGSMPDARKNLSQSIKQVLEANLTLKRDAQNLLTNTSSIKMRKSR